MENKLITFAVISHMPGKGGWGNGYVALPEGHPCFKMDYDSIHETFDISVHGGLTFADYSNKHISTPDTKGMWVVGFDTLHYGDNMSKWPDEQSVLKEAEELKKQLEALWHEKTF